MYCSVSQGVAISQDFRYVAVCYSVLQVFHDYVFPRLQVCCSVLHVSPDEVVARNFRGSGLNIKMMIII